MWQPTQLVSCGIRGMLMLAKKELLPGVKKVHLDKCPDCLAGKQNRATFRPRPRMYAKLMQSDMLVHNIL